ncbi:P-loop containing nucleoside triphosphate hydrolase protein [Artomyces pyxidatus]|uniref:P-loop containing nucleoside triphosphate hydrolase protein n=1 Tax=Artomyces pyxidatus TaxID=48021 RepID=A0ACB8SHD3_9AGAM|nr:P-loop containing nucleoside triphosphate hydrolase protein [Artomyces pyxidatus]
MSGIPPPFDWSKRSHFKWNTEEGREKLRDLVSPSVGFNPAEFQLKCSAHILDGTDVFCISATGDGKSALIYIPAIARKGTITLVIMPTNFLESDMEKSLKKRGVHALTLNAETLAAATRDGRQLWEEAKTGQYPVILLAPETLRTDEFGAFILDAGVRARWGTTVVDESHLVVDWGVGFRPLYLDIWSLRARAPPHHVMVALSASVEPGRQMAAIMTALGFDKDRYHLEKRDCERRNVDLIFRVIIHRRIALDLRLSISM